ncbi:MAG: hypothetical protein J6Y11_10240 [Paludibacteraceae bacterium]|nr:hypothetical protein [Paludibacteraceae bacterium]
MKKLQNHIFSNLLCLLAISAHAEGESIYMQIIKTNSWSTNNLKGRVKEFRTYNISNSSYFDHA